MGPAGRDPGRCRHDGKGRIFADGTRAGPCYACKRNWILDGFWPNPHYERVLCRTCGEEGAPEGPWSPPRKKRKQQTCSPFIDTAASRSSSEEEEEKQELRDWQQPRDSWDSDDSMDCLCY